MYLHVVVNAQDDNGNRGGMTLDRSGGLDTVLVAHRYVHEHNVRREQRHHLLRLLGAPCLSDNLEVGVVLVEPLPDSGPKQRMVVDQQDPDPASLFFLGGPVRHVLASACTFVSQPVASQRPWAVRLSWRGR